MSDDGVVAEKRNRGRAPKSNDVSFIKTQMMYTCPIKLLTKHDV